MATTIIGLDFGIKEIRACEVFMTLSNTEVRKTYYANVLPLEHETLYEAQVRTTRTLLEKYELLDEVLACPLPPESVTCFTLELPFDKPSLIKDVLPNEIQDRVPFDIEDLVFDHQVLEKREGYSKLLIAYSLRETFDQHFQTLQNMDLDPKVLTLPQIAISAIAPQHAEPIALIDIGTHSTSWGIYHQGNLEQCAMCHEGGSAITTALSKTFKVNIESAEEGKLKEAVLLSEQDLQAIQDHRMNTRSRAINDAIFEALTPMVREISRALAAYEEASHQEIKYVYLMGGGSALRGLLPYLEHTLATRVQYLQAPLPLQQVSSRAAQDEILSEHVAYGMSALISSRNFSRLINFRKDEYVYKGDFNFIKHAGISVSVASIFFLLFFGFTMDLQYKQAQHKLTALETEIKSLGTRLLGTEDLSIDEIQEKLAKKSKFADAIPEVSALDTLGELSKEVEIEVQVELDHLHINMLPGSRATLTLNGKTATVGDVSSLIKAVEKTSCFANKVKKDKVSKAVDQRTSFKISASSSCQ
jgi:Tfp pilus assembly PilM family ATPase